MVPVVPHSNVLLPSASLAAASAQNAATPKPSKPRVWTVFSIWFLSILGGTAASIFAYVLLGVVVGVILGAQGAQGDAIQEQYAAIISNPLVALLLNLAPFQLGVLALVFFAARLSPEPTRERLGLVPATGRPVRKLKLASLAGFTLASAFASAVGLSALLGEPADGVIGKAITQDSLLAVTIASLVLSLLPAIAEEVAFRGYIQRRLLQRWSPKVAIAVSTLLFAIMHSDSLHHVISVIPLGVVTGLLAYRTGSVKAGIVVHALHNGGLVVIVTALRLLEPTIGEDAVGLLVIGGGLAMFIAGGVSAISLLRKDPPVEADRSLLVPVVEPSLGQAA